MRWLNNQRTEIWLSYSEQSPSLQAVGKYPSLSLNSGAPFPIDFLRFFSWFFFCNFSHFFLAERTSLEPISHHDSIERRIGSVFSTNIDEIGQADLSATPVTSISGGHLSPLQASSPTLMPTGSLASSIGHPTSIERMTPVNPDSVRSGPTATSSYSSLETRTTPISVSSIIGNSVSSSETGNTTGTGTNQPSSSSITPIGRSPTRPTKRENDHSVGDSAGHSSKRPKKEEKEDAKRQPKKRGIFPKQATNILRAWLFANLTVSFK